MQLRPLSEFNVGQVERRIVDNRLYRIAAVNRSTKRLFVTRGKKFTIDLAYRDTISMHYLEFVIGDVSRLTKLEKLIYDV